MKKAEVESFVEKLAEKLLEGGDIEVVDVEYVREKDWYLRVFIDKEEGIELEDCQMLSEKLTEVLDEEDPIKEKYYLEVSSPGIDRPLKKDKDFIENYGLKVDVNLYAPLNGKKSLVGVLESHDDNELQLRLVDKGITAKKTTGIDRKSISMVRPHIDF